MMRWQEVRIYILSLQNHVYIHIRFALKLFLEPTRSENIHNRYSSIPEYALERKKTASYFSNKSIN